VLFLLGISHHCQMEVPVAFSSGDFGKSIPDQISLLNLTYGLHDFFKVFP
jgi:hypothetical protein